MSAARVRAASVAAAVLSYAASGAVGCAGMASLDRGEMDGTPDTTQRVEDVPVRGYRASVELESGESVDGELLAVDEDDVWIEPVEGAALRRVARRDVALVTVYVRGEASGGLAAWTVLGTLSTLSHGRFAVFSAPVWLAAGVPSAALESSGARADVSGHGLDALFQFARYPQGLPDAIRPGGPRPLRPVPSTLVPGPAREPAEMLDAP